MATEAAARPGTMGTRAGQDRGLHRGTWLAMLLWSAASLVASFVLAVEAVTLAGDPDAVFNCDINAVISCGTVASSWQASVFGFPNAFLGLVTEPVVITVAVAGLAGIRFPRWFMLTAQTVYKPAAPGQRPGLVVDQEPRRGFLSANDRVLLVATKSRYGVVPDLVGTAAADAEAALGRLRVDVQVVDRPGPEGVVVEQRPAAGVAAAPGLDVTLVVGSG